MAPLSEELLKALVIVALIRASRIGFLVDGAIYGFAVGSGFALFENLHYLQIAQNAGLATWIVRGFGTAIMHGGTTALFTVMALTVLARRPQAGAAAFVPGLLVAVLMHGAFNHLGHVPQVATLVIVVLVPASLLVAFHLGEKALGQWLGSGFDKDAEMLDLITSGDFANSPPGVYLAALKRNLDGPLVADILCYLRVYTELSLRAKGLLMMRESGFVAPGMDDETRRSSTNSMARREHRAGGHAGDAAADAHEPAGPVAALHAREERVGATPWIDVDPRGFGHLQLYGCGKSGSPRRAAFIEAVRRYPVPPMVRPSMRSVGWPTPTGTLWPSLPQVPMPGSRPMSLPIIVTRVRASGPLPISVAPLTGWVIFPFSIMYASAMLNTNLPFVMSTWPPPKLVA